MPLKCRMPISTRKTSGTVSHALIGVTWATTVPYDLSAYRMPFSVSQRLSMERLMAVMQRLRFERSILITPLVCCMAPIVGAVTVQAFQLLTMSA